MKGERQRWKYGEGRIDRRRRDEKERQSVKLLCTSLTSWTESAQLLKRSERWGKHADTDVHARTRSISPCLGTQHDRIIIIIAHTHTYLHMCSFVFLRVSLFFLQLCVSIHVSGYVCLKTVSQRISRDLLVILLNTHPPPPHPPTTQFGFSAVSTFHQRGFNVVPSI